MIAFDTNIFIYALQGDEDFGELASQRLTDAGPQGIASMLVYAELLSWQQFAMSKLRSIGLRFLDSQPIQYVSVDRTVLLRAAELRAAPKPRLELPDAIHIASALQAGATTFVTNDLALTKLSVDSLEIISLSDKTTPS